MFENSEEVNVVDYGSFGKTSAGSFNVTLKLLLSSCSIPEALPDQQRHHVCEGSRPLGHTLQIRRADEHPDAFQVSSYTEAEFFFKSWMLL